MTDVDRIITNLLSYIYDETGVEFVHNWPPVPPHYMLGQAEVRQSFAGNVDAPQRIPINFLYAGDDIEDIKTALVACKLFRGPMVEDFYMYDEGDNIRDVTNEYSNVWNEWTEQTGCSFTTYEDANGKMWAKHEDTNATAGITPVLTFATSKTWASVDDWVEWRFKWGTTGSANYYPAFRIKRGGDVIIDIFPWATMIEGRDFTGSKVLFTGLTQGDEWTIRVIWASNTTYTMKLWVNDMYVGQSATSRTYLNRTFSDGAITNVDMPGATGNTFIAYFTDIKASWYDSYFSGITAQSNPVVTELGMINNQWHYAINIAIEV